MRYWIAPTVVGIPLAALSVFCLVSALAQSPDVPATFNKDGSATITLSKEQWQACEAGGGCLVAPRATVEATVMSLVRQMCGATI